MSEEEAAKVNEMLDDAARSVVDRQELRSGFYTDPTVTAASWHHMSDADINEHHRSGIYRHSRHPLSSVEPPSERKRSSSRQLVPPPPSAGASATLFTPSLTSVTESNHPVSNAEEIPVADIPVSSESSPLLYSNVSEAGTEAKDVAVVFASGDSASVTEPSDKESENKTFFSQTEEPPVPSTTQRPYSRQESMPKVAFILGEDPDDGDSSEPSSAPIKQVPSKTSTAGKTRRSSTSTQLDPQQRRRLGSELSPGSTLRRVPTEHDEAVMLEAADLEDMASHRFDDTKGLRRRKITHHSAMASIVHIGQIDAAVKSQPTQPRKRTHYLESEPHKMFVELDELRLGDNQEWAWQEKARWIKFEEEIEEGALRWGKPHVSSLSFHSLLELRRCLEQGVVVLDLDANDLPSIANHVVDQLVLTGQLPADCKGHVLKALLLKHRHLADQQRPILPRNMTTFNLFNFSHSHSASNLPGAVSHQNENESVSIEVGDGIAVKVEPDKPSPAHSDHSKNGRPSVGKEGDNATPSLTSHRTWHGSLSTQTSQPPATPQPADSHILHRIPPGAEATNVLVGSVEFLSAPVMAFVRLQDACELTNLTEVPLPVRFIFILLGPTGSSSLDYHEIGRSISTLMADERFHEIAYIADNRKDMLDGINSFLQESIVLPPGDYDQKKLRPIVDMARQRIRDQEAKKAARKPSALLEKRDPYGDPLKRTRRLFGGLVNDVKRRFPHYLTDFKDALNVQCIAAFFFIYFACLSPAITFGGLMSSKTDKWMGVSEMLLCTSVCGILYALLSAQPLIIIGATGPIIVFEEALFKVCNALDVEFLVFRLWISVWIGVFVIIVVMLEGAFLVRYFTRFMQDIFIALISLIFIYETFKKIFVVFAANPLIEYYPVAENHSCSDNDSIPVDNSSLLQFMTASVNSSVANETTDVKCSSEDNIARPNTALLSLILTLTTFLLALALKEFRNSHFLGRNVRRAIGDFGVPISIIVMALIAFLIPYTYIQKLDVPDGVSPTAPLKRSWFINPIGLKQPLPIWLIFAAIVPAILIFILLFMETQITSTIVNKKDRMLKKGSGYHLDMLVIGLLTLVGGFMGAPFMVAATVRSVAHVSALSVFSRTHAPGEKPRLVQVFEQRLTALAVHILIGVSVLMGPLLRQVPLAVLFGVFLYMGVASMSGVQLLHRVKLIFMPVKHHPDDVGYVRRVRLWKMNLFTFIQLLCLGILWAVKSTAAALAFPFVLILLVPMRLYLLPLLFTNPELAELDCDEDNGIRGEEDEPDFYVQAHMPV